MDVVAGRVGQTTDLEEAGLGQAGRARGEWTEARRVGRVEGIDWHRLFPKANVKSDARKKPHPTGLPIKNRLSNS